MLTNNKDLNKLLKLAQGRGWEFTCKNNHIKGSHPSWGAATISRSPSDNRAIKNIKKDLKLC